MSKTPRIRLWKKTSDKLKRGVMGASGDIGIPRAAKLSVSLDVLVMVVKDFEWLWS
jgi:hypothetical protein